MVTSRDTWRRLTELAESCRYALADVSDFFYDITVQDISQVDDPVDPRVEIDISLKEPSVGQLRLRLHLHSYDDWDGFANDEPTIRDEIMEVVDGEPGLPAKLVAGATAVIDL